MADKAREIAQKKSILTPERERLLWARTTTIKRILIKAGLTTHEDFEGVTASMVRDINNKVEEKVRKDLGLDKLED